MILQQLDDACRPVTGPLLGFEPISATNNLVYRVWSATGAWCAKRVSDEGLDLDLLRRVESALAARFHVPRILHVAPPGPFAEPVLVTEHVDGTDVAACLEGDGLPPEAADALLDLFAALPEALRAAALPGPAWGLLRPGGPAGGTREAWLAAALDRYVGRLRAFAPAAADWDHVRAAIRDAALSCAAPGEPSPFGADLNLKNFLVTPTGSVRLLNLPLVARGEPAYALASATIQLAGTPLYDRLSDRLLRGASPELRAAVRGYEMLILCGILAFHARGGTEAVRVATAWGTGQRLMGLLEARCGRSGP